jgi:hypothetical protein
MFTLFQKKTKNYSQQIEQIHEEFNTADVKILSDSNKVLNDFVDIDRDKAHRLKSVGFVNAKEAKDILDIERVEEQAKKNIEFISYYAKYYPFQKFIIEKEVDAICKKYNLVCGGVEKYKGFVPKDKLELIENFKLRKEDEGIAFENGIFIKNGQIAKRGDYYHIFNKSEVSTEVIKDYSIPHAFQSNDGIDWYARDDKNIFGLSDYSSIRTTIVPPFKICAPIKDMDTIGMRIVNNYRLESIPDPIVLKPVNGGYLVVACWGDEASDEIVVNEKMN